MVPVHIEKLQLVPRAPDRPAESVESGPVGELQALVRELTGDPKLMAELKAEFTDLRTKLEAAALHLGGDCADPQDEAVLREALTSVQPLLSGRVGAKGARK
jgi:hypothetical protein